MLGRIQTSPVIFSRKIQHLQIGLKTIELRTKKGLITHERKHRLNIAGFEWRLRNEYPWEEMFDRLVAYKESYKNTNVPRIYKKDTKLANWVQTQRGQYKRNALLVYRINRLNGIGFQWKHRYV